MSVGALHYGIRDLPPNILYVSAEMRGRGLDRLVLCCTMSKMTFTRKVSMQHVGIHPMFCRLGHVQARRSLLTACLTCIPIVLHQSLTKRACRSSRSFVHFRTRLPCVTTWLTSSPVRGKRSYFLASLSTFLNLGDDMHPLNSWTTLVTTHTNHQTSR